MNDENLFGELYEPCHSYSDNKSNIFEYAIYFVQ